MSLLIRKCRRKKSVRTRTPPRRHLIVNAISIYNKNVDNQNSPIFYAIVMLAVKKSEFFIAPNAISIYVKNEYHRISPIFYAIVMLAVKKSDFLYPAMLFLCYIKMDRQKVPVPFYFYIIKIAANDQLPANDQSSTINS